MKENKKEEITLTEVAEKIILKVKIIEFSIALLLVSQGLVENIIKERKENRR